MSERIVVAYRLAVSKENVQALARKIAIEQSVETPESVITPDIEQRCVGRIEKIEAASACADCFDLELSYSPEMLSGQYNQLINLCFGNVSMYQNVRLTDIRIPNQLLANFEGPLYGVEGVRKQLGVYERPLLATALKPRGQTDKYFAELAYGFACGGGDIIKDDQNLIGSFDSFKKRVRTCLLAIDNGSQKSGRNCFYFPFISAPFEEMERHFEFVKLHGGRGVLLSPLIIGLDTARGLANKYELMYMAHPAFTGSYCIQLSHGMDYKLLYGLLFRLAGVDISVFPNQGGRFSFAEQDCKDISYSLQEPLGKIKTAFPCPAGGMHYKDLEQMCRWFGKDAVFLLGGSLLEYSDDVESSTRAFRNKINECLPEKMCSVPAKEFTSSCEVVSSEAYGANSILRFDNYCWHGRQSVVYKTINDLPYRGVRRVELVGQSGEKCTFDLRYFEIEENGYSSLEKHQHTHVIIGARGKGEVLVDAVAYTVHENDILYIKPLAVHQLKATGNGVFGFYCIVDRIRDKPQTPH